jgi:hypothetical protein
MKKNFCGNEMDKMPNWAFRIMAFMFNVADIFKSNDRKLDPFNIQNGQTVIDYGSGTGRYLHRASELVGVNGQVYPLDMFHMVGNPHAFLLELHRLTKSAGILYLEDGHQPRSLAKEKVLKSGCWEIIGETKTFIRCKPKTLQPNKND